jgi:hypothetical protein
VDLTGDVLHFTVTDDLVHFGVKGMRWGVRKQDVRYDRWGQKRSGKGRLLNSEDVLDMDNYIERINRGTTRSLSNKELKDVVERMRLERAYDEVRTTPPVRGKFETAIRKTIGDEMNRQVSSIVQAGVKSAMTPGSGINTALKNPKDLQVNLYKGVAWGMAKAAGKV